MCKSSNCQLTYNAESVVSNSYGHVLKSLKTSNGSIQDFIIDTGGVFSIIHKPELILFYPSEIISPTRQVLEGIAGHSLDLVGQCIIPIMHSDNSVTNYDFLVSISDSFILLLNTFKQLHVNVSFLIASYENKLKDLFAFCSKTTGGMHMPKIRLDVAGDPVFLKRQIIPFGLREAV